MGGPALNKLLYGYERRALSFQTVAELDTWILMRAFPSEKIARLEAMLSTFEVLWPDEATCLLWAQLMHHGRSSGRPAVRKTVGLRQRPSAMVLASAQPT